MNMVDSRQDVSAIDEADPFVSGPGIRDKLQRSHFRVAIIGLLMLALALGITAWLRVSAVRLARERGPTAEASMRLLSGLHRSLAELTGFVAFADPDFRSRREAAWQFEIRPAFLELRQLSRTSSDLGAERLDQLLQMVNELEGAQVEIEKLSLAQDTAGARDLLREKAIPLGRQVTGSLRGISAGQVELMKLEASLVNTISYTGMYLLLIPIFGMALVVVRVSKRGADEITGPIIALSEATRRLAAGDLTTDVPVVGTDEVAQLTQAFNRMRAALARRTREVEATTASIRATAVQLAAATSDILSAVRQLAEGVEFQAGDVGRTHRAVDDVTRVAGDDVKGAEALAESAQWADAIGRVGLKTVDASVFAMGRMKGEVTSLRKSISKLALWMKNVADTTERMNEIAEQARVLALKAANPAAAGSDQGPTVTADEAEALAAQSRNGAQRVRECLAGICRTMNEAAITTETTATVIDATERVVRRASDTMRGLTEVAAQANLYAGTVVTAAARQASHLDEIRRAMAGIANVSQADAVASRAVEGVARQLQARSEELKELLAGMEADR